MAGKISFRFNLCFTFLLIVDTSCEIQRKQRRPKSYYRRRGSWVEPKLTLAFPRVIVQIISSVARTMLKNSGEVGIHPPCSFPSSSQISLLNSSVLNLTYKWRPREPVAQWDYLVGKARYQGAGSYPTQVVILASFPYDYYALKK